jgi:hypothetical protein
VVGCGCFRLSNSASSFGVDILAFLWLGDYFGYFFKKLGKFFKSSGHPECEQLRPLLINYLEKYFLYMAKSSISETTFQFSTA